MSENNPDFEIEEFWLGFKTSMLNVYKDNNLRPIKYWSDNLNNFQSKKMYNNIEDCIKKYISLYAIDVLKVSDSYNIGILHSNIKRWNRISKKYCFNDDNEIVYDNIIFLLVDLFRTIYDTDKNYTKIIFSEIELFLLYKDFSSLINFSVKYNKPSIIDKIIKYTNINETINTLYNLKLKNKISGKKLFDIIV